MKTPRDQRHLKRVKAVQELYAWDFSKESEPKNEMARQTLKNLVKIDEEIKKAAPEWPINQINHIDLAILRLAIFELIIKKGTPFKVVVDEAIEIAKEFGSESSPGFINGVLGKVISEHKIDKEKHE